MSDLDLAIRVATDAHAGQVDRQGEPYNLHPLRVMLAVPEEARVAAVLHDIIEDTPLTLFGLAADHGFAQVDVTAVDYLTRPGTGPARLSYAEYIARLLWAGGAPGRIARAVKVADLKDNLARPFPGGEGLAQRYRDALVALNPNAPYVGYDPNVLDHPAVPDVARWMLHGRYGGAPDPNPREPGEGNAPIQQTALNPNAPFNGWSFNDPVNPNAAAGAAVDNSPPVRS